MEVSKSKLIIIGSGPAGYSAAIYAARANLAPLIVQGIQPGGQLTITTDVENYPGYSDIIQGPWLMDQMKIQAEKVGAIILEDTISSVNFGSKPFKLKGQEGKIYATDSVIIATGANAKWLGLKSEEKYRGFGVSACATCDAFFFKERTVAVVGGGNTALEEALYLTKFASKVTLIHRRESFRAEKILQKRVFDNDKIEILWNTVVTDIYGTENPLAVNSIFITKLDTGRNNRLAVDGIFIAIGHEPNTNIFKGQLKMDKNGYILTDQNSTQTNINGIFAAGDVHDKIYRQAITAAGYGCMAALEVEKFLSQ